MHRDPPSGFAFDNAPNYQAAILIYEEFFSDQEIRALEAISCHLGFLQHAMPGVGNHLGKRGPWTCYLRHCSPTGIAPLWAASA
jgi:hypothetical protein